MVDKHAQAVLESLRLLGEQAAKACRVVNDRLTVEEAWYRIMHTSSLVGYVEGLSLSDMRQVFEEGWRDEMRGNGA